MWPFRRNKRHTRPMSEAAIIAQIDADHYAYLRKHGLSGPSPNNSGTPENPYGSLALTKEYQDYIRRFTTGVNQSQPKE